MDKEYKHPILREGTGNLNNYMKAMLSYTNNKEN